jgi:hypothetical protein
MMAGGRHKGLVCAGAAEEGGRVAGITTTESLDCSAANESPVAAGADEDLLRNGLDGLREREEDSIWEGAEMVDVLANDSEDPASFFSRPPSSPTFFISLSKTMLKSVKGVVYWSL